MTSDRKPNEQSDRPPRGDDDETLSEGPALNSSSEGPPGDAWPPDFESCGDTGQFDIRIENEEVSEAADQPASPMDAQSGDTDKNNGNAPASEATVEQSQPATDETPEKQLATLRLLRQRVLEALFHDLDTSLNKNADLLAEYQQLFELNFPSKEEGEQECQLLREQVLQLHEKLLQKERSEAATLKEDITDCQGTLNRIATRLEVFVQSVAEELQRLDPNAEMFTSASEEVKDPLVNHRKGIEIIDRILKRTASRKPQIAEPNLEMKEGIILPDQVDGSSLSDLLRGWAQSFRSARDQNYQTLRDGRDACEKAKSQPVTLIKSFLSAVDGIDSGLLNESALAGRLSDHVETHPELFAHWLHVYERLSQAMQQFFVDAEIVSLSVENGTPFDPETMEPQGTIANPELENDAVGAMLRRGLALDGQQIRPILVEVVRND